MPSEHIKPLLLLLPFLLSACAGTSDRQQLPLPDELWGTGQAEPDKNQSYAVQIQQAVTKQLSGSQSYRGKNCTVRISIQPDGMLMSAAIEKGDPEFCQAVLSAVSHAQIPPAPDKATWQTFRNASLDFAY